MGWTKTVHVVLAVPCCFQACNVETIFQQHQVVAALKLCLLILGQRAVAHHALQLKSQSSWSSQKVKAKVSENPQVWAKWKRQASSCLMSRKWQSSKLKNSEQWQLEQWQLFCIAKGCLLVTTDKSHFFLLLVAVDDIGRPLCWFHLCCLKLGCIFHRFCGAGQFFISTVADNKTND